MLTHKSITLFIVPLLALFGVACTTTYDPFLLAIVTAEQPYISRISAYPKHN